MFRPSPTLNARLRLTTKQVNKGYYKGTRTGSMGAHTEYGGYLIDYRKVRNYNVPDLEKFKLTPFVTNQMEPTEWGVKGSDGNYSEPKKVDGMTFLRSWRDLNPTEYDEYIDYQRTAAEEAEKAQSKAESEEDSKADMKAEEEIPDSERRSAEDNSTEKGRFMKELSVPPQS